MAVERLVRLHYRQPGFLVPRLRMGRQPARSSSGLSKPCRPPCALLRLCALPPLPWPRRGDGPPRPSLPPQQPRAPPQPSSLRPPCAPLRLCAPLPPPWPRRGDGPPRPSLPPQQPRAPPQPSWLRPPCALLRLCAPLPPPWPRRGDGPPRPSLLPQQPRAPPQPSWLRPPCAPPHVRPHVCSLGGDPLLHGGFDRQHLAVQASLAASFSPEGRLACR